MKIVFILLVAIFTSGCSIQSEPIEAPQQQKQESKIVDKYEWKKVNEMTDKAGNKICAYKIAGDMEWWDIVVVYDNEGVIKQVLSKQFRN